MRHVRGPPSSSNIVRALNTFGSTGTGLNSVGAGGGKWVTTSGNSTPAQSQPSSPMRKEPSPFLFPSSTENSAFQQPALDQGRDSFLSQKMQRIMLDRVQVGKHSFSFGNVPCFYFIYVGKKSLLINLLGIQGCILF